MNILKKITAQLLIVVLLVGSFSGVVFASKARDRFIFNIEGAKEFNEKTIVGTIGGRYPQEAKDAFTLAIDEAQAVEDNQDATDDEIYSAINALQNAIDVYEASRIAAPWDPYAEFIPEQVPVVKRDFRASWVSTVINLDWPSPASAKITDTEQRVATQKAELIKILDEAVEFKLNAVIFQVRPTSDAFFQSELAPWSYFLTNSLNGEPGFDPLAFAIEEAHARNLELHAWFNPYRVSMTAGSYGLKTLDEVREMLSKEPKSIYAKHPEWVKVAQSRLVLDPGIPAAREYVEDCIMEVVDNYDVDAIHFDDYFYVGNTGVAGSDGIIDTDTYELYNNGEYTNIQDWRRGNTQKLVENLSSKIKAAKPWVKWGISPAGVWRNDNVDPTGSATKAGAPNYDHAYADTKKWVVENTIDYIVPQIYWSFGLEVAKYGVIADWWSNVILDNPQTNAQLYIGEGLYRLTENLADPYWARNDGEAYRELERQLKYNLAKPGISGSILFRHNNMTDPNAKPIMDKVKDDIWASYALVPTMTNLGGTAPKAPTIASVETTDNGNTITIIDNETSDSELVKTKYFAIYKEGTEVEFIVELPQNIIALVNNTGGTITYVDENGVAGDRYFVTALNRLHDESEPSEIFYENTDKVAVTDVKINAGNLTVVKKGKTISLNAEVTPADASNQDLIWVSSNPDVVSVDANGNVKGENIGIVMLTVSSVENPEVSHTVLVRVMA